MIESFSGNARIIGMDSQEVKVTGRKTIRSLDQKGADRANDEAAFEIVGSPDQVIIRTNQNRASGPRRVSEEMEILVPKGASIDAHGEGRTGDFDIHDVEASLAITSDNASVRLEISAERPAWNCATATRAGRESEGFARSERARRRYRS